MKMKKVIIAAVSILIANVGFGQETGQFHPNVVTGQGISQFSADSINYVMAHLPADAVVVSIWPDDPPFVRRMTSMAEEGRIFVPHISKPRSAPITSMDLNIENANARVLLANSFQSAIRTYRQTLEFMANGDAVGDITEIAITEMTNMILRDLKREGAIFFNARLPDGSMIYNAHMLFSIRENDVANAVEQSGVTDNSGNQTRFNLNETSNDLNQIIDNIRSVLERNPALNELNEVNRQLLLN